MDGPLFVDVSMHEKRVIKGYFWHIHHEKLMEWSDNIEERIEYIKKYKPIHEQETRLRLMTPVMGPLPEEFIRVCEKDNRAWEDYLVASKKYDEAYESHKTKPEKLKELHANYSSACLQFQRAAEEYHGMARELFSTDGRLYPELVELHKREHPDCPWNGKTIFSQ